MTAGSGGARRLDPHDLAPADLHDRLEPPTPTAEKDARCPICNGMGWTGCRYDDSTNAIGHYHCRCGAACAVDRAEGCAGARPIPPEQGGTFLSALLDDQRRAWDERHGVIPPGGEHA